jgi:NADPH:quinone reductase-like Zn-dependent oxidoreductase
LKTGQGALTEFTKLPATHLVLKSSNVSAIEACGLPLAGETAFQALVGNGKLQAGQSVFINGGSSAVGMNAIYIAKALGAKVVTSASSRNEEICRNAGADEVSAFPCSCTFADTSPVRRLYEKTSSRALRGKSAFA